jgi:hypothetical protein
MELQANPSLLYFSGTLNSTNFIRQRFCVHIVTASVSEFAAIVTIR